jgi:hypothetical protein
MDLLVWYRSREVRKANGRDEGITAKLVMISKHSLPLFAILDQQLWLDGFLVKGILGVGLQRYYVKLGPSNPNICST